MKGGDESAYRYGPHSHKSQKRRSARETSRMGARLVLLGLLLAATCGAVASRKTHTQSAAEKKRQEEDEKHVVVLTAATIPVPQPAPPPRTAATAAA